MSTPAGEDLLGSRALDADARLAPAPAADALLPLLVFRLANGWYAVDAHCVQEVVPTSRPVAVPGVPGFVSGVVNLSGRIIVQMNVGALLGVAQPAARAQKKPAQDGEDERPRCVVLESGGLPFALVAEEVAGLMEIPRSKLNAASKADGLTRESFALEEKVVSIMDVPAVLARAEESIAER